jgi:hypothetical protein
MGTLVYFGNRSGGQRSVQFDGAYTPVGWVLEIAPNPCQVSSQVPKFITVVIQNQMLSFDI